MKKKAKVNLKKLMVKELVDNLLAFNDLPVAEINSTNKQQIRAVMDEFLDREDKVDYYEYLLEKLIEQGGPRNDEVLHFYIRAYLNLYIPRQKKCRNHKAPFTFISDLYFERVINAVGFANRTGGKTIGVAVINQLNSIFKAGCESAGAGAILAQANKQYKYFNKFHLDNDFLYDRLERPPTKSLTRYKNGSEVEVVTGTVDGLNSLHPNKLFLDEVELMPWDVLQQGLSASMTTKDKKGNEIGSQIVCTSTRKFGTGPFQRLLDIAKKGNTEFGNYVVYCWCIWEILEKCTRKCKGDPRWGDCPQEMRDVCGGRAHTCSGWYSLKDFISKVVVLDKDRLEAEWFCKKPSEEMLVYGKYWNPAVHMITKETKQMEQEKYRDMRFSGRDIIPFGVIDFGATEGHNFVFQQYCVDVTKLKRHLQNKRNEDPITEKAVFYLMYEYRSAGDTLDSHVSRIKQAPYFNGSEIIFVDPTRKQDILELQETYKLNIMNAINAREPGIEMVKNHLYISKDRKRSHFYIFGDYYDSENSSLMPTHKEFTEYRYRRTTDGKPNKRDPLPINDHGMDCVRYMIQSAVPLLHEYLQPIVEEVDEDDWWEDDFMGFDEAIV